ncbi:MAG: histidine kinase [Cyanobacteria bacterium P01_H01_bin.121]
MNVPELISIDTSAVLQLLLFVDSRLRAKDQIYAVEQIVQELAQDQSFDLQILEVAEQPHLIEHFRLVVTPALIRIRPLPHQVLAGSNLEAQLKHWWPRWEQLIQEETERRQNPQLDPVADLPTGTIVSSSEVLRLSDEVFQLAQEKAELLEQLRFKDRIIAMLAHDLRNPLTAASLAIETLSIGFNPDDARSSCLTPAMSHQLVQQALTQIKAIDHMVTDILQAARGTNRDDLIQPQKLDLNSLCEAVLQQLRERVRVKNQLLEADIPADLPIVYADRERIQQVLINLLDNAIKYTPEHGKIQLSVLHRTTQKVQISICDTGLGIPEAEQESIFEATVRLKRDEKQDGYGIGLSVCRRIIQAHYGRIWVDSVPNQGSCFHFTLPVYRA